MKARMRWPALALGMLLLFALLLPGLSTARAEEAARTEGEAARTFRIAGRIISAGEHSIIVKTLKGEVEVRITSDTEIHIPGVENPQLGDLGEGRFVVVKGVSSEEGVVAEEISVPPRHPLRSKVARFFGLLKQRIIAPFLKLKKRIVPEGIIITGEVSSVSQGKLIVKTKEGEEIEVLIPPEAEIRIPGAENPSLEDIEEGARVMIKARKSDGELEAEKVIALEVKPAFRKIGRILKLVPILRHMIFGKVEAVSEDSITIKSWWGKAEIKVTSETKVRMRGNPQASVRDLEPGTPVIIIGREVEGEPVARLIIALSLQTE